MPLCPVRHCIVHLLVFLYCSEQINYWLIDWRKSKHVNTVVTATCHDDMCHETNQFCHWLVVQCPAPVQVHCQVRSTRQIFQTGEWRACSTAVLSHPDCTILLYQHSFQTTYIITITIIMIITDVTIVYYYPHMLIGMLGIYRLGMLNSFFFPNSNFVFKIRILFELRSGPK